MYRSFPLYTDEPIVSFIYRCTDRFLYVPIVPIVPIVLTNE